MIHPDTWEAIASGAANTATTGDIQSASDVLEHAAACCERRADELKMLQGRLTPAQLDDTDLVEDEIAHRSTARELRTFVKELAAADAAVSEED